MDYADNATHIAKWQWDLIHDPGKIVRVFERDEDAMATKSDLLKLLASIRNANIDGKRELEIDFDELSIRGSEEDITIGGKLTHIYVHYGTITESSIPQHLITINPSDKHVAVFEGKLYNHKYKLQPVFGTVTLSSSEEMSDDTVTITLDSVPLYLEQVPETYLIYCFPSTNQIVGNPFTENNASKPMLYIFVLEKEKAIFEEYIYTRRLLEESVMIDIPWVSQYDSIVKDIQGDYLSCTWNSSSSQKNTCCYTTCWYMCHQYTQKRNMNYMNIAHLKNDTVYNSGLDADKDFEQNIQTLLALLASKTPVMIGVNKESKEGLGNKRNPATHHWVVGMGIGKDAITGNTVIYFHEVGTTVPSRGDGSFLNNKLEVDMKEKRVTGKKPYGNDEQYIVTAILYTDMTNI
jgi:hypothetical protein